MPDTPENQQAYPQSSTQAPGCGFPIAKIGVLFSLTTGTAIALVFDVLNTHDVKLARRLYEFIHPNDVLLGDRAFCAYADLVFVKNRQADVVFRKHQGRKQELRRGKIVGSHDKLVVWHKPKTCPKGLTKEEFAELPLTLTVREVNYYIAIPGVRTQQVSLITTLLDSQVYSTLDLVKLYEFRWDVELDLKHLKTTLLAASGSKRRKIYRTLLAMIVHKPVPERPGRSEPRVRKRRPKAYPLMQQPRCVLRQQMVNA